MFVSSTDKRPVYFGSDGLPLRNGSIAYFEHGSTTTPKTVYTDAARTVAALNPQILGIDGRTPTEIYLGEGAYTIQSFMFGSVTHDNRWDDYGIVPETATSITNITNVATIAALAAIDTSLFQRAYVLGYYSEGDLYTRYYEWVTGDTQAGNGGTVIKRGSGGAGSWILRLGNTDVLDVRIFGAIAGGSTPRNGSIHQAEAQIAANKFLPQTLYFPQGTYCVAGNDTQYLNCITKLDLGVYFSNKAISTTYTLKFMNTFKILGTAPLKAGFSPGTVTIQFLNDTDNSEVNLAWLGVVNTSSDQGERLRIAVASVNANYTLYCDSRVTISVLTQDFSIPNTIRFEGTGGFILNQFAHYIEFVGSGRIINDTSVTYYSNPPVHRGVLFQGPAIGSSAYSYLKFTNYEEIRSSWFADDVGDGNTIPLDYLFINANGQNSGTVVITQNTPFIFDHPVSLFSNLGTSQLMTANVIFKHEYGLVSKKTGSGHVWLTNSDFGNEYIFGTNGFIVACDKALIPWWIPPSATTDQLTNAWVSGINSALHSGSILELCGRNLTINLPATTSGTSLGCKVQNGFLSMSVNYPAVQVSSSIPRLDFFNVNVISSANNAPLVSVSSGGSVDSLTVESCDFSSYYSTALSASLVEVLTGGSVTYCDISRCHIEAGYIVSAESGMSNLNLHDNHNLVGDLLTDYCCVRLNNNKITGGVVGKYQLSCVDSGLIEENRFYQCDLFILDNAGFIDAIVSGNQFESTDKKYSRVIYEARTVNTVFAGAICSENSWTGSVTTPFTAVSFTPNEQGIAGVGIQSMWSNCFSTTMLSHKICMTDNASAKANIYVPCTRGSVQNPKIRPISDVRAFMDFYDNNGIFCLPYSLSPDSFREINVSPTADLLPNVPRFIGFESVQDSHALGGVGYNNGVLLRFENLPIITDPAVLLTYGVYIDMYEGN